MWRKGEGASVNVSVVKFACFLARSSGVHACMRGQPVSVSGGTQASNSKSRTNTRFHVRFLYRTRQND